MERIRHCYIDISTATSAGKTDLRIHPAEGKGVFFSDATRDARSVRGDIEQIIREALDAKDRIRVIVTRECRTNSKSIRGYVECDQIPEKLYESVLEVSCSLSQEIEFFNAIDNRDIAEEIRFFRSSNPNANLEEFGSYLEDLGFKVKFDSKSLKLVIEHNESQYVLPMYIWTHVNWDSL